MPISKIPIVHKFGIISHTQRLELQERLLKQSYAQTAKSQKVLVPTRNPLEVSEEFVQEYNNAKDFSEREKLEQTAEKMLERAKRRAGLKERGVGKHVNLPMAWTELAQLAQCRGKIQEECLDVLIISLDQSPLEKYHIPALFFLAETMLYWLRTDAVHQPYLRTGEIKLLKMGQLVFSRLFYHHMTGQLSGQKEFKNRLFTYLDGLLECQEAYSPYPNALLSLRFIITVGKIIMSDTELEPGEVKEGDNVKKSALSRPGIKSADTNKYTFQSSSVPSQTSHSAAISSSVHDLSPTLWHALDVWRCTNHLSGGLSEALKALSHCGMGLLNESWVDSMIALQILAEAAKSSLKAMRAVHNLARGYRPPKETKSDSEISKSSEGCSMSSDESEPRESLEQQASAATSKPILSDIFERSEEGESNKASNLPGSSESPKHSGSGTDAALETSPERTSPVKQVDVNKTQSLDEAGPPLKREVSFDNNAAKVNVDKIGAFGRITPKSMPSGHRVLTRGSIATGGTVDSRVPPGTGYQAEAGTTLPSGRASEASTVLTFTNTANPDMPGINGWHWEVAITYTDILADICLHGSSADIQKMALMGINNDVADPFKRGYLSLPLPSAGLLDLAFFKAQTEVPDKGPNDWSWRIRFGAVQSLVKICRCLENDKNREGLRTATWNTLLRAHSLEKDERVLEALKVGQVHTDVASLLEKQLFSAPQTLGAKVAAGLSQIYLPPLPPPVDPYVPPKKREVIVTPATVAATFSLMASPAQQKTKARTSLQEEIMLATALYEPPMSFNTRTSFDLRRIVEDQWRKDLQKQMEEEEKERLQALKEMLKDEEESLKMKTKQQLEKIKQPSPNKAQLKYS